MRELSFADVRAAGLSARVELAYVTYEYRPLRDDVAVRIATTRQPHECTTSRIPETGWFHEKGCLCSYCRAADEAGL